MGTKIKQLLMIGLMGMLVFGCSNNNEEEEEAIMSESKKSEQGNPVVKISTTKGDITLKLDREKAPVSVENFLSYANGGHYDNTIFHRVIDGFMVQGGGFTEDMKQKPTKDPIKNEARNGKKNKKGTIAMARTSDVDSATSQFFINLADNEFLDYQGDNPREFGYCVFGEVIDGMEVVDRIKSVKTGNSGMHQNVPVEAVEIQKVALVK